MIELLCNLGFALAFIGFFIGDYSQGKRIDDLHGMLETERMLSESRFTYIESLLLREKND